jgi:N-acetylglutamate synthase-like GNAT family acetyltransferase
MQRTAQVEESVVIRPSQASDFPSLHAVINAAAERYRGVIPADCWHAPYMAEAALAEELAAGVQFSVFLAQDRIIGVMGLQFVDDVALIRHAYVHPGAQHRGVGSALLRAQQRDVEGPLLIGTWAAATWAVAFYQRRGFALVTATAKDALLVRYWNVPPRQRAASVVLADAARPYPEVESSTPATCASPSGVKI